jgi:hypothetical protein
MAISSKIEEIIFEITKTAGNIYDALKIGIGNINTPKSSIFELNNLLSVAQNGITYFGVISKASRQALTLGMPPHLNGKPLRLRRYMVILELNYPRYTAGLTISAYLV